MKIAIEICDLCKKECVETEQITLSLTHEKCIGVNWTSDICVDCAKNILKKLRSRPDINITPKKEPVYRSPQPPPQHDMDGSTTDHGYPTEDRHPVGRSNY